MVSGPTCSGARQSWACYCLLVTLVGETTILEFIVRCVSCARQAKILRKLGRVPGAYLVACKEGEGHCMSGRR
eukprot:1209174-Heterocapsa_arctica.AAC.1